MKYLYPTTGGDKKTVFVQLDVFLDEQWDEVEKLDPCERKRHSKARRGISLPPGGEFGPWVEGKLSQSVRAHVWYFAVSTCDGEMENATTRVRWEGRMLQPDKSELSVELQGMLTFHLVYLIVFLLCLGKYYQLCKDFVRSAESLHPVIWVMSIALLLQLLGEFMRAWYLWGLSSNGLGTKAFDVLAEIFFMLSQVMLTSLLILIGLGYTLVQSKIGDLDLMIPMVFMIAVIHIMLVGFGKIKDDASYKWHENEGAVGWILLLLRVALYAWFFWAVQSTSASGGPSLQRFLRKFLAVGSLYFLGFPVLFMTIGTFAPYYQHKVMVGGMVLIQTTTNLWLSYLLLFRGEYFKVSTLSESLLPGGAKVGMTKDE